MTPEATLYEILSRLAAADGEVLLIGNEDLSIWPPQIVAEIKARSLIRRASPASSAPCPGCERECTMPVVVRSAPGRAAEAFIQCDRRSDTGRVPVPTTLLERWQTSGAMLADLLTRLLGLHAVRGSTNAGRWEVGLLRGQAHSGHVVLMAERELNLHLAGHSVPVADVLMVADDGLTADRRMLERLVDHPVSGAGDRESAEQRRQRLQKRVFELQAKGVKAFNKAVAKEEDISVSRLKQILAGKDGL